jgi:hypothetical protein
MAVLTSLASADIYQDLTVNLNYNDCSSAGACYVSAGSSGSPAYGGANFTSMPPTYPPWTYNLATGPAYQWGHDIGGDYYALFNSGTFNMTGPYGLTFNGTISSGSAYVYGGDAGQKVDVTFSGYWSDGIYATGGADLFIANGGTNSYASLSTAAQAPEPSSLALFGSGVLGLGGLLRRRFLG